MCLWLVLPVASCVAPTSSEGGWVPGVPETAPAEKTPPHLGRQDCVVVLLPPPHHHHHPRRGKDGTVLTYTPHKFCGGQLICYFRQFSAHSGSLWTFAAFVCLPTHPPHGGGGIGICLLVWCYVSELHAFIVLCSVFLPSLAN